MPRLTQALALKLTALLGAAAVALGAFGAHGLGELLAQHGRTGTWETAALYHFLHTIVMLVLVTRSPWRPLSWCLFAAGILIFSGSLYLLCLTGIGWLGAVTPIGGLLLIAAWLALLRKAP